MQTDPPGGTGVSFWQSIELKRHNPDVSRERQFDDSKYLANCDARETCGLDLSVRQRASPAAGCRRSAERPSRPTALARFRFLRKAFGRPKTQTASLPPEKSDKAQPQLRRQSTRTALRPFRPA